VARSEGLSYEGKGGSGWGRKARILLFREGKREGSGLFYSRKMIKERREEKRKGNFLNLRPRLSSELGGGKKRDCDRAFLRKRGGKKGKGGKCSK